MNHRCPWIPVQLTDFCSSFPFGWRERLKEQGDGKPMSQGGGE
jgi:hypothetical protein